jgi:hypothetical protein
MKKTKQTSAKLLVIIITTAAIIAAVTTTSLSAATPAFAKINCDPTTSTCSGGGNAQTLESTCSTLLLCHGGLGGRTTLDPATNEVIHSGGGGLKTGTVAGGAGDHSACDVNSPDICSVNVGGSGQRP